MKPGSARHFLVRRHESPGRRLMGAPFAEGVASALRPQDSLDPWNNDILGQASDPPQNGQCPPHLRATGRMTRKQVPCPGELSTSMRPAWSWTMPWVML